jgi:hypothetical protein
MQIAQFHIALITLAQGGDEPCAGSRLKSDDKNRGEDSQPYKNDSRNVKRNSNTP